MEAARRSAVGRVLNSARYEEIGASLTAAALLQIKKNIIPQLSNLTVHLAWLFRLGVRCPKLAALYWRPGLGIEQHHYTALRSSEPH
jgi:hypothetical protein